MQTSTRYLRILPMVAALLLAACATDASGPAVDPETGTPSGVTSADVVLQPSGDHVAGIILTVSGAAVDSVVGLNTVAGVIATDASVASTEFVVAGESLRAGTIARVYFADHTPLGDVTLRVTEVVGGGELAPLASTGAQAHLAIPTVTLTARSSAAGAPTQALVPSQAASSARQQP